MVKYDGQTYASEDDIPDFGSIEVTSFEGDIRHYQGLATDVPKLPHYCGQGSDYFCLDTQEVYIFHKKLDTWVQIA
jgi:hypothetical protein